MSKQDKLIERFLSEPKDFTFNELVKLMSIFGYKLSNKGKTSGSRIIFFRKYSASILIHKPHQRNYLLIYQIKEIENILRKERLL